MDNIKKENVQYFLDMDLAELFGGGEAARAAILDEEGENGEFSLSDSCTELFAEDLKAMDCEELASICKTLSL